MSDTVSSQFDAKNQDDQVRSIIGDRRRWTAAAAGMSSSGGGQMPGGGYPPTQTHHLPPTVPNPTPTSSLPQRLRLPPNTPPAHQHMPPWRHSPTASQATGLGSLPSGMHTYFGSPHLSGRGGGGMTAWQAAAAKPAGAHAHTANPLFSLQSLQMMVTAADLPGSAAAPDYQQETMDLSSHSEARRSPKKESLLRNGGNNCISLSNGEMAAAAAAADLSSPKPSSLDSVSVIAQNPLRESVTSDTDKALNCSSKTEVRSEKAAEFPTEPHTDVDKASPLPSPASPEPAASAPPVIQPEQKSTRLDPDSSAAHTPDNVESILENMFRIQEEKQPPAATPSSSAHVTPHSVIVPNDARTTHHSSSISTSLSKEAPVCSPPEKINEQKLIEILEVEDSDRCQEKDSKEEIKVEEVKKEAADADVVSERKHDDLSKTDCSSVKDEVISIAESVDDKPAKPTDVTSSSVEEVTMVNDDNTVVISESEDESREDSSAVKTESSAKVKDEPDSMFTEVESELEKMFAGIVEPGSEEVAVKEEAVTGGQGNKRRGRPKGALGAARRSSDTSFSGLDSASKKRKGSDVKKGAKKVRIDVAGESSNQLTRKGRPTSLSATDASKSRGPVVHVEGSRDNPTSVVVVNGGSRAYDEDDANEKSGVAKASFRKQRAIFQTEAKTRGQGAGLYNSTLSLRYDSQTADSTWLCVLCKQGPHYEPCAGDLFGPYVVSLPPPAAAAAASHPPPPPCDYDLTAEQKRRAGGKLVPASLRATGGSELFVQKAAKKHKRTVAVDSERMMSGVVPVEGGGEGGSEYEVWVHEACAVWAPGVYMIGARLIGLQDAVAAAIRTRCGECGEPGASIGCISRGCRQLLHLGCARRAGWHLDQHNFISKCSQHANTLHTEYGRR
ncbi:hypothetical protein LSTR_LSTR003254 [Laodelphax striatellus]|uniref:PHD-type domain-containing protein n=1 Tax=Laodelphax striatellus TaxID=195883 RepID=A0A482XT80_LAOST|nr:hypothetical protein LSTR_LSTR003254 [Laodelphax striatellus]